MTSDTPPADDARVAYRTCPLCEAGCGLEISVRGHQVVRIRGDRADVFSHGFICPKGSSLKQLHDDPDRLRQPLVRRDGDLVPVTWDEAWTEVSRLLTEFYATHPRQAMATYHGNPTAHSLGAMVFGRAFSQAIGNSVRFTASTVDQMPRQVAAAFVFGSANLVPVPDLDRTDLLVILGANPMVSNGSLCTAPDFPGRLAAIRERGGRVVVIDPKRTRTAREADQWLPIRPGTDALLLAAIVSALHDAGAVGVGDHLRAHVSGVDDVLAALAEFTPESVAEHTGLRADEIRGLAAAIAAAPTATVYGRIGTTTSGVGGQGFGTLASWLIDVVNTLSGNLDRPGGAMFPRPAAGGGGIGGGSGKRRGYVVSDRASRVSGYPTVLGEHPAAAMAEEITTPGDGQIRGLITVAGNPVLSTPNAAALDAALGELDVLIAVDPYVNETTRHADVVLPPPSVLARHHYDVALLGFAVRNVANFSEPVFALEPGQPDEWEILAKLAMIAQGLGPDAEPSVVEDLVVGTMVRAVAAADDSPVRGRTVDELMAALDPEPGPPRVLDILLQTGPYGAWFGTAPGGLSLATLRDQPHGVDLGALEPRLPGALATASSTVELAPPALLADLDRLRAALAVEAGTQRSTIGDQANANAMLIGRRHLRSNNSWMHNLTVLVKGTPRCTLEVHPEDAAAWGLRHGGPCRVASRVGSIDAVVEVTDDLRRGVVSMPHGWGHGLPGTRMRVAAEFAGVNSNVLTDDRAIDPLSATTVLNGIPVTVSPLTVNCG